MSWAQEVAGSNPIAPTKPLGFSGLLHSADPLRANALLYLENAGDLFSILVPSLVSWCPLLGHDSSPVACPSPLSGPQSF